MYSCLFTGMALRAVPAKNEAKKMQHYVTVSALASAEGI